MLSIACPESTSDRTYEGEVWGDLRAEGFIWGEHKAEHDSVYIKQRSNVEGDGLRAMITNVSSITLLNLPDGNRTNATVECVNRSFIIIADNGSIWGMWWDLDFSCIYQEFNGTFPGDDEAYFPDRTVRWVEGRASVRHDPEERQDIEMDDCVVIVDSFEYLGADSLLVPEGETAEITIYGVGLIRVSRGLYPHINGSLWVNQFVRDKGNYQDTYQTIRFDGDDIAVKEVKRSMYATGGGSFPGHDYDPWIIEVTVSPDTEVRIHENLKLPVFIYIPILVVSILVIFLTFFKLVKIIRKSRRLR